MDDEYQALVEEARDALRALLVNSEPGTGLSLHSAYNDLKRMHEKTEAAAAKAEAAAAKAATVRRHQEQAEQMDAWRKTPRTERKHRILNALRDDRLTVSKIMRRLQKDWPVYENDLRPLIKEMLDQGELDRAKEPRVPGGVAWCWRYHRRTELGGEIEALERSFDELGSA
jgi:hypothetical protein